MAELHWQSYTGRVTFTHEVVETTKSIDSKFNILFLLIFPYFSQTIANKDIVNNAILIS